MLGTKKNAHMIVLHDMLFGLAKTRDTFRLQKQGLAIRANNYKRGMRSTAYVLIADYPATLCRANRF